MRVHVIAVGRLKQGPERELADRYLKRFEDAGRALGFRGVVVKEIAESRARDAATRMAEESAAIITALPPGAVVTAMDERGEMVASTAFADILARIRDRGVEAAYVIGGADGLSPELRRSVAHSIAFGRATWPHQLVRVMLFEQLYRAATVLAGHPYHRP